MGDRYYLIVKCPKCKFVDDDVYYAPTCGFMTWKCPKCNEVVNSEKYSGIDAEGCANTNEGIRAVRKLLKRLIKMKSYKTLRQAIRVSIEDLEKQIRELKIEQSKEMKRLGLHTIDKKQTWIIPIINKQPECSDTWEFE